MEFGKKQKKISIPPYRMKKDMFQSGAVPTEMDGRKISVESIDASKLTFTPTDEDNVVATINSSEEGIKIDADKIKISGSTVFETGYDPTEKVKSEGGSYESDTENPRIRIFPDTDTGIEIFDDDGNSVFRAMVGGDNVGDVEIGDYGNNQGIYYDKSDNYIYVKGQIKVENPADVRGDINVSDGADNTQSELDNGADIDNAKANGYTLISGGYIATDILTADHIETGTLDADKVSVTNINADNITAGSIGSDRIDVDYLSSISAYMGTIYGGTFQVSDRITVKKDTGTDVGHLGQDPDDAGIWGYIAERGYGLNMRYGTGDYFRVFMDSGSDDAVIQMPDPDRIKISDTAGNAIGRWYGQSAGFTNRGGLDLFGVLGLYTASDGNAPSDASTGQLWYNTTYDEVWVMRSDGWKALAWSS